MIEPGTRWSLRHKRGQEQTEEQKDKTAARYCAKHQVVMEALRNEATVPELAATYHPVLRMKPRLVGGVAAGDEHELEALAAGPPLIKPVARYDYLTPVVRVLNSKFQPSHLSNLSRAFIVSVLRLTGPYPAHPLVRSSGRDQQYP